MGGYSIWCYRDYGPCFNYDLEFVENKMNVIKFYRKGYKIPYDFLKKKMIVLEMIDIHIFF